MDENPNWKKQVMELASFYSNLMIFLLKETWTWRLYIIGKLNALLNILSYTDDPHKTLKFSNAMQYFSQHAYTTCYIIVCTLPVTSCSCERSFSDLKRLKTYLQSIMGQERMNDLEIDNDAVIDMFARKHPRRMA